MFRRLLKLRTELKEERLRAFALESLLAQLLKRLDETEARLRAAQRSEKAA